MRSDLPFSNNVNFSHQPTEVAEVTVLSPVLWEWWGWGGQRWGRETERDPSSPQHAHTPVTLEGGRLLWLFVTCFDTLLLVVTKRNFLVTKLIVFDGVIRNNYLNNTVRKEGNPFYFLFAEHKRDPGHAGWGVPETWHSHRWDLLGEAQPSLRHPPALWEQDEQEL